MSLKFPALDILRSSRLITVERWPCLASALTVRSRNFAQNGPVHAYSNVSALSAICRERKQHRFKSFTVYVILTNYDTDTDTDTEMSVL